MIIAISWSTWFIWSHLVNYFSENHEIIAFNRRKQDRHKNINYVIWDLNEKIEKQYDFDFFIHCASDTGYDKSDSFMIKNNVESNKNVMELVNNTSCKHFVYLSSASVYQWLSWTINEEVVINKDNLTNPYSLSKFLAEEYIIRNLKRDVKLTIFRSRWVYWDWDRTLLPNLLKHKIINRLLMIWNGETKTSLTYVSNFVESVKVVLDNQQSNYEIFNVWDNDIYSFKMIYELILKKTDFDWYFPIPNWILTILKLINSKKYNYLADSFLNDKILNISKIKKLWYSWRYSINDFFNEYMFNDKKI